MTTTVGHIAAPAQEEACFAAVIALDTVARRRISLLLEHSGITVAVNAPDGLSVVAPAVSVAVLVSADGDREFDALRALRKRLPDASIVVVIRAPGGRAVRRALDCGADGIVDEASMHDSLVPTIHAVRSGQLVVPRPFQSVVQAPVLSNREKQVLGLVVMGLTNGEIAERMYLAESTIKSHLSSAFAKLDVRSRNEAAALILNPDSKLGPGIIAITPSPQPVAAP